MQQLRVYLDEFNFRKIPDFCFDFGNFNCLEKFISFFKQKIIWNFVRLHVFGGRQFGSHIICVLKQNLCIQRSVIFLKQKLNRLCHGHFC